MDIFDEQLLGLVSSIFTAERVCINPINQRLLFKNCTIVKQVGSFAPGHRVDRICLNFKRKKDGFYATIGDCETRFTFCADWGEKEINDKRKE